MNSGKQHLMDGMELPNQAKIRTLGEKRKSYKYLGILKADTIKQVEMKEKFRISEEKKKATRDKTM